MRPAPERPRKRLLLKSTPADAEILAEKVYEAFRLVINVSVVLLVEVVLKSLDSWPLTLSFFDRLQVSEMLEVQDVY